MIVESFGATLARTNRVSPTTLEFQFVRKDGRPVLYQPGQFFRFDFRDQGESFERSYSIATCNETPGSSSNLDLLISYVEGGKASQYLFKAEPGIDCAVKGPFGNLLIPAKLPRRLIMVATSVGIAPYLPMLLQLEPLLQEGQLQESPLHVEFIFGVRSREEFLYAKMLQEYAAAHARFNLSVCYSRQQPSGAFEHAGYVQDRLMEMELDPQGDHVLLCGNPVMIDAAFSMLAEKGFGISNVTREKYAFARETTPVTQQQLSVEQKKLIAEKLLKHRRDS
jgi:ferredoxin-NADP reductase|tara:strand:+ start:14674 stop:15513 length:840 start_codon:yes stop_codon:yes gene_type:complete